MAVIVLSHLHDSLRMEFLQVPHIGDVAALLDDIPLLVQLLHQCRATHCAADKAHPIPESPSRPLGIGLDRRSRPPHVQCLIGDVIMPFLHNTPNYIERPPWRAVQELRRLALFRKVTDIPHPPEHLSFNLLIGIVLRPHKFVHPEILGTARI